MANITKQTIIFYKRGSRKNVLYSCDFSEIQAKQAEWNKNGSGDVVEATCLHLERKNGLKKGSVRCYNNVEFDK